MGTDPAPMPGRRGGGLVERGSRFLALQLRLMSVLQLLAGVGYIVLAVFLQFPPGDPLTLGLWAIGCLAVVAAVFGLFGGCRFRCCLGVYVVLAVLATLAQAGLVLYLFIAPADAEEQIASYQRAQKAGVKENLHTIVIIGRWVLLGLLGAQVATIGLAACLRCCGRPQSYEEFQEEEEQAYDARHAAAAEQLDALKLKLGLAEAGAASASSSKRVINLTAVSGSAAERQQQQQRAMRSSLFERCDTTQQTEDAKLEAEMEAGKISTRVATEASEPADANPFDDAAVVQPSPGAWPAASTPSAQHSFKPSWSKAGKR